MPDPSIAARNEPGATSATVKVNTPDGTMFVTVVEQETAPRQVFIHIGKSGHSLQAWADALACVISLALRSGLDIQAVITEVSSITTDRRVFSNGINVRSGPDGLAHALLRYVADKSRGAEDERISRLDG